MYLNGYSVEDIWERYFWIECGIKLEEKDINEIIDFMNKHFV